MKIFARAFVVFFAIILAGCGTVLEATKSSLSGIKVSSPVTRQVGLRAETHRLIIKNRLHLMSSVAINGKTSDIKLYPNEDVVFSNNFEPFHSAEVSIVLIFREADGSYAGYAEKVFASGSFAGSERGRCSLRTSPSSGSVSPNQTMRQSSSHESGNSVCLASGSTEPRFTSS